VVSVKDFGAVGDGVTDDTAAIQAALSGNHVAIYVPAGRYNITSNLTKSGHTYIYGDGLGASQGSVSFCVKSFSTNSVSFSLRPNPGVQVVRINWVAFGQ
jgi:hypothetical protein